MVYDIFSVFTLYIFSSDSYLTDMCYRDTSSISEKQYFNDIWRSYFLRTGRSSSLPHWKVPFSILTASSNKKIISYNCNRETYPHRRGMVCNHQHTLMMDYDVHVVFVCLFQCITCQI